MPDLEINLDTQITKLKNRWRELDELYPNPPGPTADEKTVQRGRIIYWMDQINEKITSFEMIKTNKQAARVIVRGPTDEEKRRVEEAMANLSNAIQRGQTFAEVTATVTTILNSATTVNTTAGRGEPKKG